MRILVPAGRSDFHALVVQHAMRERGHRVDVFATDDFFRSDTLSLEISTEGVAATMRLHNEAVDLDAYDVVWSRRPYQASTLGHVFPDDRAFVASEIRAAFNGIYRLLERACWVNPLESIARAENKILQLRLAIDCGFDVPETLVSTNVEDITRFIRRWPISIYKPLTGHVWKEDGARRATYTSCVREEHLGNTALISTAPGIYQRRIERAYEVRAQFFGSSSLALKISVEDSDCVDWRLTLDRMEGCGPAQLPASVGEACRALMDRLGILCGAFDFIVGEDGRWFFLEVNQGGQFLFLEQCCPSLPTLDMFCSFLERPSPGFTYTPGARATRYLDIANDLVLRESTLAQA